MKYARTLTKPKADYFTAGTLYPIKSIRRGEASVIDDEGDSVWIFFKNCPHIEGDWDIIDLDPPKMKSLLGHTVTFKRSDNLTGTGIVECESRMQRLNEPLSKHEYQTMPLHERKGLKALKHDHHTLVVNVGGKYHIVDITEIAQ